MKQWKKYIVFVFTCLLLVAVIPSKVSAASVAMCGKSVYWTYDWNTDTLRISGEGPMYDYAEGQIPWETVSMYMKHIQIDSGVTYIGGFAFYNMTKVESIEIPTSVEEIGYYALLDCDSLKKVTLKRKDIKIGTRALGYQSNYGPAVSYRTLDNFVIRSYSGSNGEKYADANKITFSDIAREEGIAKERVAITTLKQTLTKIEIAWSQAKSADSYELYRRIGSGKYTLIKTFRENQARSYIDSNTSTGTRYYYVIGKYRGIESMGAAREITYLVAPKITLNNAADKGILINWNKVNGAKEYVIYRKKDSGTMKKIKTVTATSYQDKDATTNGARYHYAVVAKNGASESSNMISSIYYLPKPTINKVYSSISNNKKGNVIEWTRNSKATDYVLYAYEANSYNSRTLYPDKCRTYTITSKDTTIKYTDTKAVLGKTYLYYLVARKGGSTSAQSEMKRRMCLYLTGFSLRNTKYGVEITYDRMKGAEAYRLFRYYTPSWNKIVETTYNYTTSTKWIDAQVKSGTKYAYQITVYAVKSKNSYAVSYVAPGGWIRYLSAPKIKKVVKEKGNIKLEWNKVNGATNYIIKRKAENAKNYETVGNTNSGKKTQFVDKSSRKNGVKYYYIVIATSDKGIYRSVQSNVVTIK